MIKIKKLLTCLIVLFLFTSTTFAVTENELKKYLNEDVMLVMTYTTSAVLYGRITDVIYIKGELYIIFATYYIEGKKKMILKAKNISYIRKRKYYE